MNPVEWLCSVVDTINNRQSRQRFWVRATTTDTCLIENLETGEIWNFKADVALERRTLNRTPCGMGGCSLSPAHAGNHRGDCGCLHGCKAMDCPNV